MGSFDHWGIPIKNRVSPDCFRSLGKYRDIKSMGSAFLFKGKEWIQVSLADPFSESGAGQVYFLPPAALEEPPRGPEGGWGRRVL